MQTGGVRFRNSSIASFVDFFQAICIARFLVIFGMLTIPFSVLAEGDFVTRRDGFLMLWESISRPSYKTKTDYNDISEGDYGYQELTYAKNRGILPDEGNFRPNEPLILQDAMLWLYRTRNIRELPDMQEEDLPSMVSDYPIIEMNRPLDGRLRQEDLATLIAKLDGLLRKEVHEVSFYADDFHGRGTAFGETFNMNDITAAHRSFPHNTLVKVTNVETKESVVVRINDRGPYVHGRDMDLSKAAFGKIAHHGQGVLQATFERLGDKDLVNACEQRQRMYQKRITRDVRFYRGIPHTFSMNDRLILQSNKPFVVRSIIFPDGERLRIQNFVNPKEKYQFSADMPGMYQFLIGDTLGRQRTMRMSVSSCLTPN